MYLPLIAAFIAISGSMGISYMANDSLPGEPLYSIKTNVTDGVRHMTAVTPEAQAKVTTEIVKEKVEEARTLEAKGRLDDVAKAQLAEEIQSELRTWDKLTSTWIDNNGEASPKTEAITRFQSETKTNTDIFRLLGISPDAPVVLEADSSLLLDPNATSTDETASSTPKNDSSDTLQGNASTTILDDPQVTNMR